MAELGKYFTADQLARASRMAAASIGRTVRVAVDRKTTIVGVIDACEPAYAGFSGRSVYVVFSVDLLCGVNKTRRNFKLKKLPQ